MAFAAEEVASGKVILLGEHAVVHGAPAIVASLDRGVVARAVLTTTPSLHVSSPGRPQEPASAELCAATEAIRTALGAPVCAVDVRFELPIGAGLGSSAAFAVATARALAQVAGGRPEDAVLNAAAASERLFHGMPSGVDAAAASHHGIGEFSRQLGWRPIACAPLRLCVGLSGGERRTSELVARVAALREELPGPFESLLCGLTELVAEGRRALEGGELARLGRLFDVAQGYLSALGVSTARLEALCESARQQGALGAKLTGAGGGGAVIALVDTRDGLEEAVLAGWARMGVQAFAVSVGTHGEGA